VKRNHYHVYISDFVWKEQSKIWLILFSQLRLSNLVKPFSFNFWLCLLWRVQELINYPERFLLSHYLQKKELIIFKRFRLTEKWETRKNFFCICLNWLFIRDKGNEIFIMIKKLRLQVVCVLDIKLVGLDSLKLK